MLGHTELHHCPGALNATLSVEPRNFNCLLHRVCYYHEIASWAIPRVFEAKFGGFRAAADAVRGRLISRNGNRMQRFEGVLDLLPKGHVFDGALVVLDDAG